MLKLFKRKERELQLAGLPIMGKRNWHFEIISKEYFDPMGNDYLTLEDANKAGLNEDDLIISEHDISDEHLLMYRYVENDGDAINIANAKRCHLGTVRMLKGRYEGKEFLFSLYGDNEDIAVQLMAYGFLTYGKINGGLLEMVKADPYYLDILKLSVGAEIYEEILNCTNMF